MYDVAIPDQDTSYTSSSSQEDVNYVQEVVVEMTSPPVAARARSHDMITIEL